jgi:replicative DNA helicase
MRSGAAAVLELRPGERQIPWDEEAEISVLGACLIDRDALIQTAASLQPEHFYREAHRRMYRAMLALNDRGSVVEPVTLATELRNRDELDSVGGMPAIGELLDAVPTAANAPYHVQLVLDCARRRQLIQAGSEIIRSAYEPEGMPVSTLVDRAEQLVFACAAEATSGSVHLKPAVYETFEQVEKLQQAGGGVCGITTGFTDLDEYTGGLQRGDLVIIAARPSMGKTAFADSLAIAAGMAGHGVLFDSLEMSRTQIVGRFLCHEALVNLLHFFRGKLQDDDFSRLAQAAGNIHALPIRIHESATTVAQLRAEARRVQAEMPELGLIIVDYIGLMDGEGERQDLRIGSITKGLKRLAKELNVALVALSQLSRSPLNRTDHRPHLGDLRDSGNIEQDADVVGFIHRPEYYLADGDEELPKVKGKAEFIIAKQRNGPTGVIELYFRKECARFEEFEQRQLWGVPTR